jgi:hypothetical protein
MKSGPHGKCALADGHAHFVFVTLCGSKVPGNFSQAPHLNKTPREVCGGHGKKKGLPEGRKWIRLNSETLPCNFLMPTVGRLLYVGFMSFFSLRDSPQWARASSFTRFLDHTQRRTTVGRTPLDESSARSRDLYLTTHNTHDRRLCPWWDSNPQCERPRTYTLECMATRTGLRVL